MRSLKRLFLKGCLRGCYEQVCFRCHFSAISYISKTRRQSDLFPLILTIIPPLKNEYLIDSLARKRVSFE